MDQIERFGAKYQRAQGLIKQRQQAWQQERDIEIARANEAGIPARDIAAALGISHQRVSQILATQPVCTPTRDATLWGEPTREAVQISEAVPAREDLRERIAAMRAQGMTLQAIADVLNEEGVPPLRRAGKWRPSGVQSAARAELGATCTPTRSADLIPESEVEPEWPAGDAEGHEEVRRAMKEGNGGGGGGGGS